MTSTLGPISHSGLLKSGCRDRYTDVQAFFRRRGAYARFKELLATEGCLEEWYVFEAESTERALREWCHANEIQLVENGGQQSSLTWRAAERTLRGRG